MQERSVVLVIVFSILTFGLYGIYWFVSTKRAMVEEGADIPTAWLMIIPIVGIWWQWKWSGGVDHVSRGKMSQVIAFLLIFLLGLIGVAIIQSTFNQAIRAGAAAPLPRARAVA